jgi:Mitochondrial K+-H+ exchange-related
MSNAVLPLTYYHFQPPSQQKSDGKRKQSIVKGVMNKAADFWAGWGKAPRGNWKVCGFTAKKCPQECIQRLNTRYEAQGICLWGKAC